VRAESLGELDVDHHAHDAIGYVLDQVPRPVAEAGVDEHRLLGVAVSAPIVTGPADNGPPWLWRGVDVVRELGSAFGVPVHLGNDANLGSMAEWIFGTARDTDDLVHVMMADGVGAGLIVHGGSIRARTVRRASWGTSS
jgi:predicted NBD/HSP70 family sugar kinase